MKGVSRHGDVVWSRVRFFFQDETVSEILFATIFATKLTKKKVYLMNGTLHADLGRGTCVELPHEETERR